LLRSRREEVKILVAEWWRRVDHLRTLRPADLVGRLAAAGFWFDVIGDGLHLIAHPDADLVAAEPVVEACVGREAELAAFLDKSEDEMTDAELAALGFRRREPGARILRDPDEPEPRAWTPPPDWQPDGDDEEARP
jgi:hypothetical protein